MQADEENPLPPEVIVIMDEINDYWPSLTSQDFNPVPCALSLLDSTSLATDFTSFCKIYEKLENAMDSVVEEYHHGFQQSINKFSGVVENISDSKRFELKNN
jgi:exocyst complex component 4